LADTEHVPENHPGWAALFSWEQYLTFSVDEFPFPTPAGRSLCRYLADESEQDGLRVYADFALSAFYYGLMPYWKIVQERHAQEGKQRTMLVCFDELSDPSTKINSYFKVVNWLYPNRANSSFHPPSSIVTHSAYSGGHATDHDPRLRSRLIEILGRLDCELFDNLLAFIEDAFPCEY